MTDKRFNIWWKLAPISAVLTVLSWLFMAYLQMEKPDFTFWCILPLYFGLWIPNAYLSTFALWHWKTRYRGRWSLGWGIAFIFWWAYFPALIYFLTYLLPEMRGKDPYLKPPETSPVKTMLSRRYHHYQPAFFVTGSFLVLWGFLATLVTAVTYWVLTPRFILATERAIPEKLSEETGSSILIFCKVASLMFSMVAITGMATAIGAILLYYSQRIRSRLPACEEQRD